MTIQKMHKIGIKQTIIKVTGTKSGNIKNLTDYSVK